MVNSVFYSSPIGILTIGEAAGGITHILFNKVDLGGTQVPSGLLNQAMSQLDAYFAKERKTFSLPLNLLGTPFRKRVWQALLAVPYGQTASYSDIAQAIGMPKAYRAVGGANHHNPISIVVP